MLAMAIIYENGFSFSREVSEDLARDSEALYDFMARELGVDVREIDEVFVFEERFVYHYLEHGGSSR